MGWEAQHGSALRARDRYATYAMDPGLLVGRDSSGFFGGGGIITFMRGTKSNRTRRYAYPARKGAPVDVWDDLDSRVLQQQLLCHAVSCFPSWHRVRCCAALQALRAKAAAVAVWDDHEFSNNASPTDTDNPAPLDWQTRKANAMQVRGGSALTCSDLGPHDVDVVVHDFTRLVAMPRRPGLAMESTIAVCPSADAVPCPLLPYCPCRAVLPVPRRTVH